CSVTASSFRKVFCDSLSHSHLNVVCAVVFFFQAEDGIRDWSVTGVQTCALPISPVSGDLQRLLKRTRRPRTIIRPQASSLTTSRSEERRVGKECRSRWSPYD